FYVTFTPMQFTQHEIIETIRMTEMEHLDIRTVTMGINLKDCADSDINRVCEKVYNKIIRYAGRLVETVNRIGVEFGITIANKRISITPVSTVGEACDNKGCPRMAGAIDKAGSEVGIDFIGLTV